MCDTIIVIRPGSILFAKNSDRPPNEAQHLDWQPRRTHLESAAVRCTGIEIPQARHTHAVLLSRPWWMWGAEMGANEHGLVIGNEAVFTRQPYEKTGLTGMDLLRLALERAETAEQACDVITTLLAKHGQGGNCYRDQELIYHNSFLLADPSAAYVLETAGRKHAVEKLRATRTISNGLTIPGFAKEHSDFLKTRVSACRTRQRRTQTLAENCTAVADLFALLRDHGHGHTHPKYNWLNGGMSAPCMHAGGFAAAAQTTASWVAELSPDAAHHWVTATAAPCVSLFKPVCVDQPLGLTPTPTDVADEESLWWRSEKLHRTVLKNPADLRSLFVPGRDATEARWTENPPDPRRAFTEADRLLEKWTAAVNHRLVKDRRPVYIRRYWKKADHRAAFNNTSSPTQGIAAPISSH